MVITEWTGDRRPPSSQYEALGKFILRLGNRPSSEAAPPLTPPIRDPLPVVPPWLGWR